MKGIYFAFVYYLLSFQALTVRCNSCRGERSQQGFALFHKNYSVSFTNLYSDCLNMCLDDPSCMSLNFWMDMKQCDLNTASRETCPTCYMKASSRYMGMARYSDNSTTFLPKSCSLLKNFDSRANQGNYVIDPDGEGGQEPFTVYCDMTDKNGVGVTVIGHDSEERTLVKGYEAPGNYSRDIHYTGATLSQLAGLTRVSLHCEQFIKYECYGSLLLYGLHGWWVSRDSTKMTYWGGASVSGMCACGMNRSCENPSYSCNCDVNDRNVLREDSGLLMSKTLLPVKQLRFGDTGNGDEGYHTLGRLKCYGTV